MNKLVYIASPVRPIDNVTLEENLNFARRCCEYALNQGVTPVAPHLIYTQILDDTIQEERDMGTKAGYVLLSHCDELWACGDYISEGMRNEIVYAKQHSIPVISVTREDILRM